MPHITESIIFVVAASSGNCIPNMSNLSTHKCARNESNTLKYSTRPRQVILFPLISLISRLSGLSSQGMSIFKFLMNSSSISTSKSKLIIFKILSSPPGHTIIHPLISPVSSPVIKLSLSYHLNNSWNPLFLGWMTHFAQTFYCCSFLSPLQLHVYLVFHL